MNKAIKYRLYPTDGLYADSEGKICGSPKYYRKSQKKLARL